MSPRRRRICGIDRTAKGFLKTETCFCSVVSEILIAFAPSVGKNKTFLYFSFQYQYGFPNHARANHNLDKCS